jgi:hypothetical protein
LARILSISKADRRKSGVDFDGRGALPSIGRDIRREAERIGWRANLQGPDVSDPDQRLLVSRL